MKWILIISFLILLGPSGQFSAQGLRPSESTVINAPEVLLRIVKEIKQSEHKYSSQSQAKTVIQKIDQICAKEIADTSANDFDLLIWAAENIAVPDDELAVYSSIENDYLLEISFNELSFRILNAIERHLESLYTDLSSAQKLTNIPILATTNLEISQKKTRLVRRQILILTACEKKEEKFRDWLAIKRMLDETDIPKSESGDQVAQRSSYGIIILPGEIMNQLTILSENETEKDIREFSFGLIKAIASAPPKYKEIKTEIALSELGIYSSKDSTINHKALAIFNMALKSNTNQEKIDLYTNAIGADSNFTAAFNNRAVCFYNEKNYGAAIFDFLKALSLDPGYSSVYKYLGNCYYKIGRLSEAANIFTEALKYDLSDTLFINRGLCYQRSGQYKQAANDFSSAIKLNSKSLNAYINRVQCYLALEQYDAAVKDYKKLIMLKPENSIYYYNLGCIYSLKKDWNSVIEIWEKGLLVNPKDELILKNLPKAKANLAAQQEK